MNMLFQEFRYALRKLVQQPGFTVTAVATLALGIGANIAIFSVINAVLLRPLPYPQADRIMILSETYAGTESSVSLPNYLDWKRDNTVFESLAISRRESRNLSGVSGQDAERISCAYVSEDFFRVIGVSPKVGRTFTSDEEKNGGPAAVIISDRLWQHIFARDPSALGQTIKLHNQGFVIVGVMPPEITSPQDTDVWFPFARRIIPMWSDRTIHPMLFVWGRLKPAVTVAEARTEMKGIAARLEKEYPTTNAGASVAVVPLLDNMVGKYRANLTMLLSAVGLVLLIACANLANLFAARGATRTREFAIRAAVGASRRQIISQLLTESLVVALLGGALGLCIAVWARDALIALSPSGVARFHEIGFGWPVLIFALGLAGLTTLVFGLWPAWQTSRADVQMALKGGSQSAGEAPVAKRTRDWLVITEIALTLTLLTGAALVLKSFSRMQTQQLGYEPRGLVTMRMDLPFRVYSTREKATAFTSTLLERVRALPGVESAGMGSNSPLMGGWQTGFAREGAPPFVNNDMPSADLEVVTGDYFSTFKLPLLRGRFFSATDTADAPRVIVIDQALAEQTFPGEDPIGKRLSVDVGNDEEGYKLAEIVGVVARMRFHAVDEAAPLPAIYCSMAQAYRSSLILFVRGGGNVAALERSVREIVHSIDPAQPVYDARSMEDRLHETWGTQRLLSFLITVFAGLSLVLATVGLYGVLSYNTTRRFREFGLRFALGATRADVRNLIFGHGFRLFAIGCMGGLAAAVGSNRILHAFLFDVSTTEPLVYAVVAVILGLVTALACWLPALRASRIEPSVALRAE